jgi:2-dehydro-3-deoxygalactonokinase
MPTWSNGFAAIDWGSTARRVYLIDAVGHVSSHMEDEVGTLSVPQGSFEAEVEALRAPIGDLPLLLAGMVGSNRGWIEAPYVPCPATLADVAGRLLWVDQGRTAIVPGISFLKDDRADVMRGEEVQVFGAKKLQPSPGRMLICHPGTHTKWIEVEDESIMRFQTVMTGELFALLRTHSILTDVLAAPVVSGPAFLQGVRRGFDKSALGADLFSVRANVILGVSPSEDAPSYASGLLIGSDLRTGLRNASPHDDIVVLGRGLLTSLYAAAIDHIGFRGREISGTRAFVAGICAIAEIVA